MNFCDNSINENWKNRNIDFSLASVHCASFMKTESKLRWGGGTFQYETYQFTTIVNEIFLGQNFPGLATCMYIYNIYIYVIIFDQMQFKFMNKLIQLLLKISEFHGYTEVILLPNPMMDSVHYPGKGKLNQYPYLFVHYWAPSLPNDALG